MPIPVVPLSELCEDDYPVRGKKASEESFEGIPVIKVRNVTGKGLDMETDFAPDATEVREECARAMIQAGDILITCTGEGTIGKVDLYPFDEPAIADGHVAICRLVDDVNPHYILEYLRSEDGQVQMLRHVSGSTGQTELLKDYVRSLLVPLPEKRLQAELVDELRRARREMEELQERASALRKESARILAEARDAMVERLMH